MMTTTTGVQMEHSLTVKVDVFQSGNANKLKMANVNF